MLGGEDKLWVRPSRVVDFFSEGECEWVVSLERWSLDAGNPSRTRESQRLGASAEAWPVGPGVMPIMLQRCVCSREEGDAAENRVWRGEKASGGNRLNVANHKLLRTLRDHKVAPKER